MPLLTKRLQFLLSLEPAIPGAPVFEDEVAAAQYATAGAAGAGGAGAGPAAEGGPSGSSSPRDAWRHLRQAMSTSAQWRQVWQQSKTRDLGGNAGETVTKEVRQFCLEERLNLDGLKSAMAAQRRRALSPAAQPSQPARISPSVTVVPVKSVPCNVFACYPKFRRGIGCAPAMARREGGRGEVSVATVLRTSPSSPRQV